ncbi:hypothetical protein WA026_016179 [Henosepilachna vigintioctopunctata]|uniref:Alpha-carbonic anhydrase domain-containing protein n=1 Tax=Henosepilachna vigintioctopunctata TaxID=420089 RepID=A0AAW1TL39_9CUCU
MSDKDNEVFQPIIKEIKNLKPVKKEVYIKLNPFNFLPKCMNSFYRYFGSLTTPNCNDVVVWTVFSEILQVSEAQVDKFRSISDPEGGKLTENFRKLQPLNGRTVFKIGVD